MGQYKVPQNVEAEDKILGPLSLKQFIYAMIGVGYGFVTFAILKSFIILWVFIGIPPMLFMLALGLYQKEDQSLETYVLAVAEFLTRPKKRLWEKEPIAEVFKLEPPPPKPELVQRDPKEVRGQLEKLAQLVDTRGWSAKRPELQEPEVAPVIDLKDRIGAGALASQQSVEAAPEVTTDDDMLDTNSQSAQNLNVLIENTVKSIRDEALEKMNQRANAKTVAPVTPAKPKNPSITGMTSPTSPDILKIAAESGDLTVAHVASQADKKKPLEESQEINLRKTAP